MVRWDRNSFFTPRLRIMNLSCSMEGGSAAAQSIVEILHIIAFCHRGGGLLGETAHDAIPQEMGSITMTLLEKPHCSSSYHCNTGE